MSDTPPDWVLLEAARRGLWSYGRKVADFGLQELRSDYTKAPIFRALCDMITKHEQPPVDPDIEAMKRIISIYFECDALYVGEDDRLERAVAQYKLEKANGPA